MDMTQIATDRSPPVLDPAMPGHAGLPSVTAADARELDLLIAERSIRSVYQPIVDLETGATVGWEALARGPVGSPLEQPGQLFAAATALGRTAELDFCCRAAAFDGALAAGLGNAQELFVNIEPGTAASAVPAWLEQAREQAQSRLRITVELTERALTADPAALISLVRSYRERDFGIALDDVGIDPRSVSLMPILRPDVIKLDMSFVQQPVTRERARTVNAVVAEAERSGARVLAEGIETVAHRQAARALGATIAQGWLFGHPGALHPGRAPALQLVHRGTDRTANDLLGFETPLDALRAHRATRRGTKALLLEMSLALEDEAVAQGGSAILLGTFQTAEFFTAATGARFRAIARAAAFVGAFAERLGPEPVAGVRGSALSADDRLTAQWDVIVLAPHFAGALCAHDLGDGGRDADRRFDYVLSYDRDLVVAAATILMERIAPGPS